MFECCLMSTLRHPQIMEFIGLCFLPPGAKLPTLVLELLETDLHSFLECVPNLPLSLKRSFLEDIASGLLYLHTRQPPVVHFRLCCRNILLTSSLVPKIAGMSNCKVIDAKPGAKMSNPLYQWVVDIPPDRGLLLDVYSFGHLAISTVTQVNLCRCLLPYMMLKRFRTGQDNRKVLLRQSSRNGYS